MQNFVQEYQTGFKFPTGESSVFVKTTDIAAETKSKNKVAIFVISQKFHDELIDKVYNMDRITRMARECKMELVDYLSSL
jgi:hypothetical protein